VFVSKGRGADNIAGTIFGRAAHTVSPDIAQMLGVDLGALQRFAWGRRGALNDARSNTHISTHISMGHP
jgi:hypothetical protein